MTPLLLDALERIWRIASGSDAEPDLAADDAVEQSPQGPPPPGKSRSLNRNAARETYATN